MFLVYEVGLGLAMVTRMSYVFMAQSVSAYMRLVREVVFSPLKRYPMTWRRVRVIAVFLVGVAIASKV